MIIDRSSTTTASATTSPEELNLRASPTTRWVDVGHSLFARYGVHGASRPARARRGSAYRAHATPRTARSSARIRPRVPGPLGRFVSLGPKRDRLAASARMALIVPRLQPIEEAREHRLRVAPRPRRHWASPGRSSCGSGAWSSGPRRPGGRRRCGRASRKPWPRGTHRRKDGADLQRRGDELDPRRCAAQRRVGRRSIGRSRSCARSPSHWPIRARDAAALDAMT